MIVAKTISHVKPVFTKHDISQVFGIPATRVTNWEAGRTIKLRPSLLEASGRGTRNVYSLADLYKTGLAIRLLAVGYSGDVVQRAIDEAPRHIEHSEWILVEHLSNSEVPRIRWSLKVPRFGPNMAHGHIVNLANIRKVVDQLIREEVRDDEYL